MSQGPCLSDWPSPRQWHMICEDGIAPLFRLEAHLPNLFLCKVLSGLRILFSEASAPFVSSESLQDIERLEDNRLYAHWRIWTSIIAAMHIRLASAAINSQVGMANRRSFRHEIISAVAKLPWHTNRCCSPSRTWQSLHCFVLSTFLFGTHILPQYVTRWWVKGLGSRVLLTSGWSGPDTCVQPPPSNIRYLLAFGTIVNRF
ncbi:hypothetical protein E4T38_09908 [Aureobasidium subglaciale]|nr:hypothetical protein E4T38_09908 [Aureobasidium subglaciale]KAI5213091.1 hypothetical protein E4T40_09919 [Aureobasidium subglaciale]KAI5214403.1 hypothetical protein E4T41_09910 [Aureobasidium subglaciale]KAI5252639.1 hypothetical protein E4T46_09903 [Aureobasidium subglaciale]